MGLKAKGRSKKVGISVIVSKEPLTHPEPSLKKEVEIEVHKLGRRCSGYKVFPDGKPCPGCSDCGIDTVVVKGSSSHKRVYEKGMRTFMIEENEKTLPYSVQWFTGHSMPMSCTYGKLEDAELHLKKLRDANYDACLLINYDCITGIS